MPKEKILFESPVFLPGPLPKPELHPTLMRLQKKLLIMLCGCASLLSVAAHAALVVKGNNTSNLNLPASWLNGVPATNTDIAVWNYNVTAANTVALGADMSWSGIQVVDPAGPVTISSGNTLTLGAAGVDLSQATNNLTLQNATVLLTPQTWNVTNGIVLTASGAISGGSSELLTEAGTGTLVLGVANTYSGGTLNNGGILQVNSGTGAGTGAITNNNGSTFRLNTTTTLANSFNFNGTVTLDLNNVGGNEGIGSPGAISGSGTVTATNQNTGARTFTLGGSASSMSTFSGTFSCGNNNGTFRFNDGGASGNTGSSAMTMDLGQGTVTFLTRNRGAAVNFGALTGGTGTRITQGSSSSGISTYTIGAKNIPCEFDGTISDGGTSTTGVAVTKTGTSNLTLTGANTYIGTTTVSSGTLQVGNGGGTGSVGNGPVVNNATLLYDRTGNFNVPNGMSGSGTTIQAGGGVLTYAGTNTSSGTLLVSSGNVALAASGYVSSPVSIAAGAAFDVTLNPLFSFNQSVSGSGTIFGAANFTGGTISPGGAAATGTLTFSNGLTETGAVNHQFELTSPAGSNDLVNVVGNLTVTGTNPIVLAELGGGTVPSGVYTLFTYSGSFSGTLANFSTSVSGVTATLTNPPNQIALIISPASRGPTNLTWVGDGVANNWDVGISSNWVNGANLFFFQPGDSVRFDNTGLANATVTLSPASLLLPAAVVVNTTGTYTLTGSGVIGGTTTSLTLTNSGTLSLQTTNTFGGPTVVGGGVLSVNTIANGNSPSSIGASSSSATNLTLIGSTLQYTGGNASTDRGMTLNGAADTVQVVTSGTTLAFAGNAITGPAALTKYGPGTLTFNVPNTYTGGTVVSNGVLALGANTANWDGVAGSGVGPTNEPVTFYGGTLQLFGYAGSTANNYSTCYNPLVVPAGQTGTLRMFPRGPLNSGNGSGVESSLTGSGTLNLVINYVRDNIDGNWSAFSGTINVSPKNASGDEFRVNNAFGYSNAVIVLNDNVLMDRVTTANATVDIGELDGTSLATIGQGSSSAASPTYRVGWKGTSSTFNGTIANDSSLTKVGAGTFTLTGSSTYTGNTTVSAGVLALSGSATISGTTNIDVQSGAVLDVTALSTPTLGLGGSQTLRGNGTVAGSVDSSSGGIIAPGEASVGVLTVNTGASLGGTTLMRVSHAGLASDQLVATNINYASGTLTVVNAGGSLSVGDTFTLFKGSLSGSFGTINLPSYTQWDTSQLAVNGTITVTNSFKPALSSIDFSSLLSSGTITLNATNGLAGGPLQVLTSTNLALPLAQWTTNSTANFDGSGNLTSFSITVDPTLPQLYLLLQAE